MAIMTADEYRESIRKMKKTIFFMGERIDAMDHPVNRPALNSVALTYDLCFKPEYEDLFTVKDDFGGRVNRCLTLWKSPDDLLKKYEMIKIVAHINGRGNARTVGADSINAIGSVSYEMDQAMGTEYHQRFLKFLKYAQDKDLTLGGFVTDPKGDRGRRPNKQHDRDMYLRVVEKKSDGIIVRGAKLHQSTAVNAHEYVVSPCTSLRKGDEEYAVAFVVPADAEGIIHFYGRQPSDTRKMEDSFDIGNNMHGGNECLVVFDDVFVPWERVFMCGEVEWSIPMIHRFAGYHRNCYGAGKSAIADIVIGAAALMAEYNGLADNRIIQDKLSEMVHMAETIYACGLASCVLGTPTDSGIYNVNVLYTNITKLHVGRFNYEIGRLAEDISGGAVSTLPSSKDLEIPKFGKFIEKYYKGIDEVPTENRMRVLRLIEHFCYGPGSVYFLSESLHGAGSPQAQKLMIGRSGDFEFKKDLAKALAGIK